MQESLKLTQEQEDKLWALHEGQRVHKTPRIWLCLPKREEVLQMQAEAGYPVESQEQFFEAIVRVLTNKLRRKLMVLDPQKQTIIGSVTLVDRYDDGKIYFGLDVVPEHQGKGYGQEITRATIEYVAKEYRGMIDKLHLVVLTDNAPAIHVYQKAGFEITATMADTYPNNLQKEVHVMEVLLP